MTTYLQIYEGEALFPTTLSALTIFIVPQREGDTGTVFIEYIKVSVWFASKFVLDRYGGW